MTTAIREVQIKVEIPEAHSKEQRDFVRCTAKRQMIKAGRRFGKTVGAAIKGLEAFLGECAACEGEGCIECDMTGKVPPKRVLYTAPTAAQTDRFWFEVTTALAEAVESGKLKKDETEQFIEQPGTEIRIKAKTAWNASGLRGDYADLLIMDEFQMTNEDLWDEVGEPMLLDNDGTAVFIYTPPSLKTEGVSKARDPRHASKLYKEAGQDTTQVLVNGRSCDLWKTFHFTSYDNPTLSQAALQRISESMSLDAYRREILAEDDEIELSWLVYHKFNEICKVKRFTIPKTWPIVSGHDFGSANPAALFIAKVKLPLPDGAPPNLRYGDYVAFKEYAPGGGFSAAQHIEKFKEITKDYTVEHSVGGNITTEGEIRQAYGAHGWPIAAPSITKVNAQIDRVIGLMELNKFFIIEDLFGLLSQISNCLWELDSENKPTNKIKNEAKYHYLACLRTMATYLPVERQRQTDRPRGKVW